MVKVTLEEENNKTIEHECECVFACLIRPAKAPEGSNAVLCLGGRNKYDKYGQGGRNMCNKRVRYHGKRKRKREACGSIRTFTRNKKRILRNFRRKKIGMI